MNDNNQEDMFRFAMAKKSKGKAYLLWFFLGLAGAHRIYCGKKISGFTQMLLTMGAIGGALSHDSAEAMLVICFNWCWLFVDMFLIPSMVRCKNLEIAKKLNIKLVNMFPIL